MTLIQRFLFLVVISSILLSTLWPIKAAPADYVYDVTLEDIPKKSIQDMSPMEIWEVEVDAQVACSLLKTYEKR
ncbi:hypothetical protein NPIL_457191 [Nephila pilipes]|uniref:Uncharacterized protein n=1 Tax=Nephila pilipes TaxID=299642 RepID=A0A8X6TYN0_NEPPI|nr:hypothetical protein NPIL_457191 [Nephila pilipes]